MSDREIPDNTDELPDKRGDLRLAHRIAGIMGPSCAAAKALTEWEVRIAAGENVMILKSHNCWFVAPAWRADEQ